MAVGFGGIETAVWEKLAQVRRKFLTSLEKEEAIPEILGHVQEILGLAELAIYAFDKDQQRLTRACHGATHSLSQGVPLTVSHDSIAGKAASSVRTLVDSFTISQGQGEAGEIRKPAMRVAIPIQIPERTIGVLVAELTGIVIEGWRLQALESIAIDLGIFVENLKTARDLRRKIFIDEITGLYTYSHFVELLEVEINRAKRYDSPLGILLLEFSIESGKIDDPEGSSMQTVLREAARLLKGACRATDVLARSRSNGMIMALGGGDIEKSILVAEKLHALIRDHPLYPLVSVSIGVASYPFHGLEKEELLFMAQQACRLAQHFGRNQVFTIGNERMKIIALRSFLGLLNSRDFHIGPEIASEFAGYLEEISSDPVFSPLVKEIVESLACAIDAKDNYTKHHSEEASLYAEAIGIALGLPEKELELARMAAKLHDLGKIGIPEHILRKPGPLNEEEWLVVKEHPTIGAKIIAPIRSLAELVPIVQCHHERWNGSGYPMGLREIEIPEGARIIAVIDSFHAIISKRPYKDAMPVDFALSELRRQVGTSFDPHIVEVFCSLFDSDGNLRAPASREQAAPASVRGSSELVEILTQ